MSQWATNSNYYYDTFFPIFRKRISILKLSAVRRANRDPQISAARWDKFGIISGFIFL
jgi:hypothetical protein